MREGQSTKIPLRGGNLEFCKTASIQIPVFASFSVSVFLCFVCFLFDVVPVDVLHILTHKLSVAHSVYFGHPISPSPPLLRSPRRLVFRFAVHAKMR